MSLDLEETRNKTIPGDEKRCLLDTAIHPHETLHQAVLNALIIERTMCPLSEDTTEIHMPFEDYFQSIVDEALVLDHNWKEK